MSRSTLLTVSAADAEKDEVKEPDKWFSNLAGKLVTLGWRSLFSGSSQHKKPEDPSFTTTTTQTYAQVMIENLVEVLEETPAKDDRARIEQAVDAAIKISDFYSGQVVSTPRPTTLCRGVGYVFMNNGQAEFALSYLWACDGKGLAPALDQKVDAKAELWSVQWRGQVVRSVYDPQEVKNLLDEQLPDWPRRILRLNEDETV